MCVLRGGAPPGTVPAKGRPSWEGLVGLTRFHPPGLRPEEAAAFFTEKVLCGFLSVWGFSESTVRGEGASLLAVARALRVHTACKPTSAVCRENADRVYFSPEPAGSWGLGKREAGAARPGPSPTSEQRRPTSGVPHFHLLLPGPALGPLLGSSLLSKRRACWGTRVRNFQPWANEKIPEG